MGAGYKNCLFAITVSKGGQTNAISFVKIRICGEASFTELDHWSPHTAKQFRELRRLKFIYDRKRSVKIYLFHGIIVERSSRNFDFFGQYRNILPEIAILS